VSVTLEAASKEAKQVVPQAIPGGADKTVPPPVPAVVTARAYWIRVNVAVTVWAASIVTIHVVPVEAVHPVQPANVDVGSGAAVSVTLVPASNGAEQVEPQLMAPDEEVTVPLPVPVLVTVRAYGMRVNEAVTPLAAVIGMVQAPVPVQAAPAQPVNMDMESGTAESVTLEAASNTAEQVAPQSIPSGDDVTVPSPVPVLVTSRAYWIFVNEAVTVLAAVIVTVQVVPVEDVHPVQPTNVDVGSGAGMSVTLVAASNKAEQV
jgi:hypothetical protein